MWLKLVLTVLTVFTVFVQGDEYFYNMRQWVKPMLNQVENGARNGMDSTISLRKSLGVMTKDNKIEIAESEIKIRIASHLKHELDSILTEMQSLIDIVVEFSLLMARQLNSVTNEISAGNDVGEVGQEYLDQVIQKAKQAVQRIVVELNHKSVKSPTEHLSPEVFQKLAAEIASDVLQKTDDMNVQKCILEKIDAVLSNLYSDEDKFIEGGLAQDIYVDLASSMRNLLGSHIHSEEFSGWMRYVIEDAVKGAKPQINLLHKYASEVINSACDLSEKVVESAYSYFSGHQNELGVVWTEMTRIVEAIKQYRKNV